MSRKPTEGSATALSISWKFEKEDKEFPFHSLAIELPEAILTRIAEKGSVIAFNYGRDNHILKVKSITDAVLINAIAADEKQPNQEEISLAIVNLIKHASLINTTALFRALRTLNSKKNDTTDEKLDSSEKETSLEKGLPPKAKSSDKSTPTPLYLSEFLKKKNTDGSAQAEVQQAIIIIQKYHHLLPVDALCFQLANIQMQSKKTDRTSDSTKSSTTKKPKPKTSTVDDNNAPSSTAKPTLVRTITKQQNFRNLHSSTVSTTARAVEEDSASDSSDDEGSEIKGIISRTKGLTLLGPKRETIEEKEMSFDDLLKTNVWEAISCNMLVLADGKIVALFHDTLALNKTHQNIKAASLFAYIFAIGLETVDVVFQGKNDPISAMTLSQFKLIQDAVDQSYIESLKKDEIIAHLKITKNIPKQYQQKDLDIEKLINSYFEKLEALLASNFSVATDDSHYTAGW